MNSITIRKLSVLDLGKISPWIEASATFREYGMSGEKLRPALEEAITSAECLALAADVVVSGETRFAGFAWFVKKGAFGRSGYLRLIAVDPAAHSRGVGRALMQALEKECTTQDGKKGSGLFLLCTHQNEAAKAFYEKIGYRRIGEIPNYILPGLNELIYFKP